jgi:hypothetical protein
LRALVTVTWRWHFDEVFVKVNGWLEQLTFARSSKFVFDLIEPERQKEIAPCWTSSSRTSVQCVVGDLSVGWRKARNKKDCFEGREWCPGRN